MPTYKTTDFKSVRMDVCRHCHGTGVDEQGYQCPVCDGKRLVKKTVEGVLLGHHLGYHALGTSTVCHLIIYVGRYLKDAGTIDHGFFITEDLGTPKEGIYLIAIIDAALHLSPTLHNKEAVFAAFGRLLLQLEQQLYLRILRTRNRFHNYFL